MLKFKVIKFLIKKYFYFYSNCFEYELNKFWSVKFDIELTWNFILKKRFFDTQRE